MVKRKTTTKQSDDISNWAVVLMLVAVIVVSTLSIVLFMDAASETIDGKEAAAVGTVALTVVNEDGVTNESAEVLVAEAEDAGQLALTVE